MPRNDTNIAALRARISSKLSLTGRHWQRLIEHQLGGFGISGACVVPLILIGRSGDGMHQVTLAEGVGVMGPTLVRLLDRLGEAGLIRRQPDPADRRANVIRLTAQGTELAAQLERRLAALRERVFADVSQADLEAAARVQDSLAAAIADIDREQARP